MPDMTTVGDPVELPDRWILPLVGQQVTQIHVSYQLGLMLDSGALVELETTAFIRWADGGTNSINPATQDVAPSLSLFGTTVTDATAYKTGRLVLTFDSSTNLTIDPHPRYEAWNITPQGGSRFVAMPGGDIAVWL